MEAEEPAPGKKPSVTIGGLTGVESMKAAKVGLKRGRMDQSRDAL
jgi:hypothetical protein